MNSWVVCIQCQYAKRTKNNFLSTSSTNYQFISVWMKCVYNPNIKSTEHIKTIVILRLPKNSGITRKKNHLQRHFSRLIYAKTSDRRLFCSQTISTITWMQCIKKGIHFGTARIEPISVFINARILFIILSMGCKKNQQHSKTDIKKILRKKWRNECLALCPSSNKTRFAF